MKVRQKLLKPEKEISKTSTFTGLPPLIKSKNVLNFSWICLLISNFLKGFKEEKWITKTILYRKLVEVS